MFDLLPYFADIAFGATVVVNDSPGVGVGSADMIAVTLLIWMSFGPRMETVIPGVSPGPNNTTRMVAPR